MSDQPLEEFHCGFVAVIGKPNAGKSTLVNTMVGEKVSIVTYKPQTTRHRILGIKTTSAYQILLVDTPGFHLDANQAINQYMNRTALTALQGVDLVLFVSEAGRWSDAETVLLSKLKSVSVPVIAVLNKIDVLDNKQRLLPVLQDLQSRFEFAALLPVSAKTGDGMAQLETMLAQRLPAGPALYEADQFTDKSVRFIAAELLREQLYLILRQELPYAVAVEIEAFEETDRLNRISALIWVAKSGHKSIVIGKGGVVLKQIGQRARRAMQASFGKPVFLNLWVKVKEGWNDDERALRSLGYLDLDC